MELRLRSCEKCKGDLILGDDEWRCLQCGRYYYPDLPAAVAAAALKPPRRETPRRYRKDDLPVEEEVLALANGKQELAA